MGHTNFWSVLIEREHKYSKNTENLLKTFKTFDIEVNAEKTK
jgi:hypothetical protein